MTKRQKLELEQSETRQKLNELLAKDELETTEKTELENLTKRMQDVEPLIRACIVAEGETGNLETREQFANGLDSEQRERLELRSRANLTNFLSSFLSGKLPTGVEAELQQASAVDGIPLELWDVKDTLETRADVATGAPSTTGINLDQIRPAVFAKSVCPMLGVDMPRVQSGTYASATIDTSLTAGAKAKGIAQEATAASFNVSTATPKRISARLSISLEDVAAVGQQNFESALRQNLSLALSDELDKQVLNGNGTSPNLSGLFQALDDPAVPAAGIVNWTGFVKQHASGVDGLWANTLMDVAVVCNPETYVLSAGTFQGTDSELSAASYLQKHSGGWWTNKRMPAKSNHIAQAILYRKGRSMLGGSMGMRTAVCPHWGQVSIDDIYSGSAKGERYVTFNVLVGDVIVVQRNVYGLVAYRISS